MSTPPLHIPLAEALLCLDCSCVGNQSTRCPACASEALHSLSAWLDNPAPRMMGGEPVVLPAFAVMGGEFLGGQ